MLGMSLMSHESSESNCTTMSFLVVLFLGPYGLESVLLFLVAFRGAHLIISPVGSYVLKSVLLSLTHSSEHREVVVSPVF